ncbi:uncharacterized protein LOC111301551 [Durio zibethinus]|uniref:Uncharacterized protein LOC111301551 n=1 Tax=Durio zibethinus TaxID=66656 RepID=A0A6P5ZL33_DURZI|nr:uncharacterized protein LOC111301551 [Durio zibethinus]XP_022753056.1 uncharacterized protein LOC111301551 [Durio zibethinus]XP_022753057.1 uncharacterized protein LOC111301551 [Durio zibethinus]XP_022753058.1 uncharacterized protein LOC111301551 [Durio zibethinus]
MSGNSRCFVEWKEEFVSQERGNRVVHYFLKDSAGESICAVVGTERSVRHMFYVVAEEFVRVYAAEHSIHAGFKWRSRREVVDWLTSMLSKQHLQGDQSKSLKHEVLLALSSPSCAMIEIDAQKAQGLDDMGHLSRNLNGKSSDIVWSGTAWTCSKQLKHFPAFCRNGTTIAVQSFVFVMARGENHYLAYLEDMYEDKRGMKKVKVRWFHHTKEVKGVVLVRNPHPKEVFITPYSQVISAECIDGLASVLTREHFEKCSAVFPDAILVRVHVCTRQFRSNKVKPFELTKLRGYFDQPILSCLNSSLFSEPDSMSHGLNEEEEEKLSPSENITLGNKRTRTNRSNQRFVTDQSGNRISANYLMTCETSCKKIKYALSEKRLLSLKHTESQHWYGSVFKVDEKIELLCQDSGIRGCWFRCTVLQVSRKQMKVQYDDVQDEDGYGNLEEWIPISKLAMPDKFGMRYSGRLTVRPAPPSSQAELALKVGAAVDAWWSDGWWEGVITGVNSSGDDNLQVYFPGENLFLNIHKKVLRISRDWGGDHWIDIEARPSILSVIYAAISPDMETKVSVSSTVVMDAKVDGGSMPVEVVAAKMIPNVVEGEKPELAIQDCSDNLLEDTDGKELQSPKHEKDGDDSDSKKPPPSENGDNGNADDANIIHDKLNGMDGNYEINTNIGSDDNESELEMENDTEQNCKTMEFMRVKA